MGNKGSHEQGLLTPNWIRIAPSFLRNTLTNELIQEHEVRFETHDQQSDFVALLNKRMANHHPHIVKVIYFKIQGENCRCSSDGKRYSLLLYTEYQGPSLGAQISSKTVQHTSTCNCLNIITVLEQLQETYGSFEINEELMFMNLRPDMHPGEKTFKLWINSKVEHCTRERLCNEQQMALSAINMLKILADHGQCRTMLSHSQFDFQGANTLFMVKEGLLKLHIKRKKINSFNVPNSRLYRHNSILGQIGQQNKRAGTAKVNSMPQRMTLVPRFHKNSQISERVLNDESNKIVCKKSADNIRLETDHRTLNLKDQNVSVKPPYGAAKINFNYSKNMSNSQTNVYALSKNGIGPILKLNTNQKQRSLYFRKLQTPKAFFARPRIDSNNQKNPPSFLFQNIQPLSARKQKKDGQVNKIVSPQIVHHQYEFSIKTVHSSPFQSEKESTIKQINKDIQIAVNQIRQSSAPPINETSPINQQKPQCQSENTIEGQQLSDEYEKKRVKTANIGKKEDKTPSLTNSGKKFQKYTQALKEYEQKIKRKNGNRQQQRDSKPMKIDKKVNKLFVQGANPSQFKETNSVYNQSLEDSAEGKRRRTPSKFRKSSKSKTEEAQNDKEKESENIENQQEQRARKANEETQNRGKEEEGQKQKEEDQRMARQQKQKQELQRDLEKEKRLIQNQMESLLRHNNMEYRNIREKVKQKKQTFAQLKAEASKILQDLF